VDLSEARLTLPAPGADVRFHTHLRVREDDVVYCPDCGYAANVEQAVGRLSDAGGRAPGGDEVVDTPGARTIEEVVAFLREAGHELTAADTVKAVLMVAEGQERRAGLAAFIRGDRDLNEVQLHNAASRMAGVEVLQLRPMDEDEIRAVTGCAAGFAGPLENLRVDHRLFDRSLAGHGHWVVGANEDDRHRLGHPLELSEEAVEDLALVRAGDGCRRCESGELAIRRGIEVGHIFQLGDKYSIAMDATFQGQDGQRHHFVMGCYGIGVSRLAAAAVEQHHDEQGIRWPVAIAPYAAVVMAMKKDGEQVAAAERIYAGLRAAGIECVLDDRDSKPGPKFKDWDLIGLPLKVICGRGIAEGRAEIKTRGGRVEEPALEDVLATVQRLLDEG